jgi:hypothetical protein
MTELGPHSRGDERRMLLRYRDYSVVKEPGAVGGELQIGRRISAPVLALGQGIALISSLPSPSLRGDGAPTKRWPGSPGRRWHGLRPGLGVKASRPAPCGAPTRHFRLTPHSAIGPHQDLSVPGGLLPRPPVGQACVVARPQVPLPFPTLKTPHENALDDGSGCGQLRVNSPIVKSFSQCVKSLLTRCNVLRYETA